MFSPVRRPLVVRHVLFAYPTHGSNIPYMLWELEEGGLFC
jgi:hypothetical protein